MTQLGKILRMNPVKKTIGYTALVVGTLGGAWGTKQVADKTCEAITAVSTEVGKAVEDVAIKTMAEMYRETVMSAVKEAYENKLQDMLIPPEMREALKEFDQEVKKLEEERQKAREQNPNADIEELQKIFSKGEKKDPFGMDSLDLDRGRNIKKKR